MIVCTEGIEQGSVYPWRADRLVQTSQLVKVGVGITVGKVTHQKALCDGDSQLLLASVRFIAVCLQ